MGQRSCCRSCRHCTPPRGEEMGWCQLRRLAIHPELAADLWCTHWTARPPRLPGVVPAAGAAPVRPRGPLHLVAERESEEESTGSLEQQQSA